MDSFSDNCRQNSYHCRLLPPIALYNYLDCSVIQLEFADLGTLIDIMGVLQKYFTVNEHEYLVAYMTSEMMKCQQLLMDLNIIHGDVKTGNVFLFFFST
jgi:DNA integrity scanning protein DisA with diadenylate cyclase activity